MMLGSTRSLRRVSMLRQPAMRQFSTLIVPYEKVQTEIPVEFETLPLTFAHLDNLQQKYDLFNDNCKTELQTMNKNIIEGIVDRGGNDGWDTNEDNMTKQFTFESFDQCQFWCSEVSKFANEKDHHPEWSITDKGCTVNVTLTSHFADNKVTRLDFELAEEMNKQFTYASKRFSQFPRFESGQIVSMQIGLALLLCGGVLYKLVNYSPYPQRDRIEELVPKMKRDYVSFKKLPETQMEASNIPTDVVRTI